MLTVITCEHSIKRRFIYMVQNHGNKRILMGIVTRTWGGGGPRINTMGIVQEHEEKEMLLMIDGSKRNLRGTRQV
jgi:hypothetical protein